MDWLIVIFFYPYHAAALNITQGRLISTPMTDVDTYPVVGIATVELGGDQQITYYFDCVTDLNNGSGIRWARRNDQNRFVFDSIPDESPGKRLRASGIGHSDLDVYICSDEFSGDHSSINITDGEFHT